MKTSGREIEETERRETIFVLSLNKKLREDGKEITFLKTIFENNFEFSTLN